MIRRGGSSAALHDYYYSTISTSNYQRLSATIMISIISIIIDYCYSTDLSGGADLLRHACAAGPRLIIIYWFSEKGFKSKPDALLLVFSTRFTIDSILRYQTAVYRSSTIGSSSIGSTGSFAISIFGLALDFTLGLALGLGMSSLISSLLSSFTGSSLLINYSLLGQDNIET